MNRLHSKTLLVAILLMCVSASAQLHNTQGRGTGHTHYGHTTVPVLLITPTPPFTIPSGTQGAQYVGYTFQAQGGTPPYLWDVTSQPGGMSIDSNTGVFTGTPSASGMFQFTAHVVDSQLQQAFGNITIVINPPAVSGVVAPTKPQNWVNSHECDPPGGVFDETKYLGTGANSCPANPSAGACDFVGAAGLQASMDTWAAQTTDTWRHVIVHAGSDFQGPGTSGGQQSGVLLYKSKVIGSRITNKCIVYESDTPNVADQTLGSHGIQDDLPQSIKPGFRNKGLDGQCLGGYYTGTGGACVGGTVDTSYNDKAKLWTITATSATGSTIFKGPTVGGFGANHILLRDVELHHSVANGAPPTSANASLDLNGSENTVAALASHVYLDRYWLHEDVPDTGPTNTTFSEPNGIKFNCNYCSLTNGYLDGLIRPGGEGHIINITDSTGPVEIRGNWGEGQSSSVFVGGAVPQIPGIVSATDLVVRQNHWGYPKSWRGLAGNAQGGMVRKNGLETKECARCLLGGNFIEEVDGTGGQKGNLLVTTVRSCSGGDCDNYQSTIEDFTVENNILRHGCQGSQGDGRSGISGSGNSVSEGGKRWKYDNNLFYDIQRTLTGCFEQGMDAGTDQGQKFSSGGSIWTNCTAGKAPNGRDAFVDCSASPDNTLGQHQTNMRVGDLAQVTGCSNTSFNSGTSTQKGVVVLSPTVPTNLVVYYTPAIAPTTQTTTLCQLSNYQGFPRDVTVTHSTVVINYNGTQNGSPMDSGGTASKPVFSQRYQFKNNIGIGGGFGHTNLEGTSTETTQWDSTLLEIQRNVWPTRTASKYSDILTFGGPLQSPPTTSFFPAANHCTGAPTAACVGMAGNSTVSSFDYNLPDWHDYRLCHVSDADSSCQSTASYYSAGQPGQADDGTDMGFDPFKIDQAMTETQYSGCSGDCGPTGPYPDVLPVILIPIANVSPTAMGFPDQVVNTQSNPPQKITLQNNGGDVLSITSVTKSGTNQSEFVMVNSCAGTLNPSAQCTVDVTFKPTTIANGKTAKITFVTNDPNAPSQDVILSGNGVGNAPAISLTPNSLNYNSVTIGSSVTKQVTLKNTGGQNLIINGTSFSGANTDNFSLVTTPNPCSIVLPNGTCNYDLTFTPLTPAGSKSATLTVTSNAQSGGNTVGLSGSAATSSGTVKIYPTGTDTIPQLAKLPLGCKVTGGGVCTYSIVSGGGTIDPSDIYIAPSSNTTAVVRATSGSNHDDLTITVTGTIPVLTGAASFPSGTANCTAISGSGFTLRGKDTMNVCTFVHQETLGTLVRKVGVVIPNNFVVGKSGIIFITGDGLHGLGNATTTGACAHPGSESAGWGSFAHTVPAPAPAIVCLEAPKATTSTGCTGGNCEWPYSWFFPYDTTTKVHFNQGGCSLAPSDCIPNDPDFQRQVTFALVNLLGTDPRKNGIMFDWNLPAMEAEQFAAMNSDQIAVVGGGSSAFLTNTTKTTGPTYTVSGGSGGPNGGFVVPVPKGPVSRVMLAAKKSTDYMSICGNTQPTTSISFRPITTDDQIAYWEVADGIPTTIGDTTQHTYIDPSGSNKSFCKIPQTYTNSIGDDTTLEYKKGTGGDLGTEVVTYKLKGSQAKAVPWCTHDANGLDTLGCASNGSSKAIDFRRPPNGPALGNSTDPATSGLDPGTGLASASGYGWMSILYNFWKTHPKPGGLPTIDLVDWFMLDAPFINTQHMAGNSTPTYSVLDSANSRMWRLKNSSGNVWDMTNYDSNMIYDKITEFAQGPPPGPSGFGDPYVWKEHVPGGLGYPWGHRFIQYDPNNPGVLVDEIQTFPANFDIYGDVNHAPGVCSTKTGSSNLGHVKSQVVGPFFESLGGSLPNNMMTFHQHWMWSCDSSWNNCDVRELRTISKVYGSVRWQNQCLSTGSGGSCPGGTLGVTYNTTQDVLSNTLTNGVATPVHPCFP